MTKKEALEKIRNLFHKTRLTKDIHIDAEIIYALLYGDE